MSDGQLTIWGGSQATGIPTTRPVRQPKRTSQGAVVIPLFRKAAHVIEADAHAIRNRDAPTTAVEECAGRPVPPPAGSRSSAPSPRTSSGDRGARPPRAPRIIDSGSAS